MLARDPLNRIVVGLLILSLPLVQTGCMSKPPSLALHDSLLHQRIALVPDPSGVKTSLDMLVKNKPGGAVKGAGQGIAGMFQGMGGTHCSGEMCGAVLLLTLAVAIVAGGTVGAIQGAMEAPDADTVADIEARVGEQLAGLSPHLDLSRKVLDHSRNVPDLELELESAAGAGLGDNRQRKDGDYAKILMIKVLRLDYLGGKGADPVLSLYIEALASIIDPAREGIEYQRRFYYLGPNQRYSAWVKKDAGALAAELERGLDHLAEDIVGGLFVSYRLPIDSGTWTFPGAKGYGCCWLCPVSPPLDIDFFNRSGTVQLEWPPVASRRPLLEWQAFPGEARQARLEEKTGHPATDIRYDLRIWEAAGGQKGEMVYERRGLPAPIHEVELELQPNHPYFWSFRACFDLGGRATCTPWAFSLVPSALPDACENVTINPWNFYRFQTP